MEIWSYVRDDAATHVKAYSLLQDEIRDGFNDSPVAPNIGVAVESPSHPHDGNMPSFP